MSRCIKALPPFYGPCHELTMASQVLTCLEDFEKRAKEILPKTVFDYYRSGADGEQTLRDNLAAYSRWRLRPRVLRDVSKVSTSVQVLGAQLVSPVAVGATGFHCMAHPEGELASARACAASGTLMMVSTFSTKSLEDVFKAATGSPCWFQLYVQQDQDATEQLVRRAERAGYTALVLTVDTPYVGRRLDDVRNRFVLPSHLRLCNFKEDDTIHGVGPTQNDSAFALFVKQSLNPSLAWEHVHWLRSITSLPIILKGILTAEDAREAVNYGVDGILVSNHGARQLDGVLSTLDALPEVVAAVSGRIEVYIDGGVQRGTDVLKALALGAQAVFIGRPVLWGLAVNGENGVRQVLELLQDELSLAMAFSGCRTVKEITPDLLTRTSYL
uniref:(S)-2-hydroxy-acid oxidase n=1 Tax=Eptatretus burgeri TaxID=7764 RepID=A0A8C4QXU3_EPTBU